MREIYWLVPQDALQRWQEAFLSWPETFRAASQVVELPTSLHPVFHPMRRLDRLIFDRSSQGASTGAVAPTTRYKQGLLDGAGAEALVFNLGYEPLGSRQVRKGQVLIQPSPAYYQLLKEVGYGAGELMYHIDLVQDGATVTLPTSIRAHPYSQVRTQQTLIANFWGLAFHWASILSQSTQSVDCKQHGFGGAQLPKATRLKKRLLPPRLLAHVKTRLFDPIIWGIGVGKLKGAALQPEQLYLPRDPQNIWADPFWIREGERDYVYVEQAGDYGEGKGALHVLTLDAKGTVVDNQLALEAPYHLSYPFLFRYKGELFMMPESNANQSLDLYKCEVFPNQWRKVHTLFAGRAIVDATLLFRAGTWYLFFNEQFGAHDSADNKTFVYYADTPFASAWKPHPANPIATLISNSRSAGCFMEASGHLYRVTQDSGPRYGYAVNLNKVQALTPSRYSEALTGKVTPEAHGFEALHTLNAFGADKVVFDFNIHKSKVSSLRYPVQFGG